MRTKRFAVLGTRNVPKPVRFLPDALRYALALLLFVVSVVFFTAVWDTGSNFFDHEPDASFLNASWLPTSSREPDGVGANSFAELDSWLDDGDLLCKPLIGDGDASVTVDLESSEAVGERDRTESFSSSFLENARASLRLR